MNIKIKTNVNGIDKGARGIYDTRNRLNHLTSREWIPETISVFLQRGLGGKHENAQIEKLHPAPYSYQDISRLINFFTKEQDIVFDPFLGVGSTLKACAINNRIGYGIELIKKYANLSKKRLKKELEDYPNKFPPQKIIQGDSLWEINKFDNNFFDFIVTSPPYWNMLEKVDHKVRQERIKNNLDTKYSEGNKKDISNIKDYNDFIKVLGDFFNDCHTILKDKKYMCIVVSDIRHKERLHPFHSDLSNYIESKKNFILKGITILYQSRKKIYPYGYPYSYVPNIHHQYILILQNVKHNHTKK